LAGAVVKLKSLQLDFEDFCLVVLFQVSGQHSVLCDVEELGWHELEIVGHFLVVAQQVSETQDSLTKIWVEKVLACTLESVSHILGRFHVQWQQALLVEDVGFACDKLLNLGSCLFRVFIFRIKVDVLIA